jgi:transcriptional regulator with GAF, ATPase, and Fis domain
MTNPPASSNGAGDPSGSPAECRPSVNGVAALVEGLRELGQHRSPASMMTLTTEVAVASLAGACDAALIIADRHGRYRTVAPTSGLPIAVDRLQYEHGGPAVDALVGDRALVHVDDLRGDHRWPGFSAEATAHTPLLSMLSYRLHVRPEHTIGSLNLYATKPHAFAPEVVHAGEQFAAYAAVILAYAHVDEKVANLEQALDTNREIGAAIGILMSRHLVTREQAFDLLRTASQHGHRKLRDLAEQVIYAGDLLPGHLPSPTPRSR